jgi:hypothetical protein
MNLKSNSQSELLNADENQHGRVLEIPNPVGGQKMRSSIDAARATLTLATIAALTAFACASDPPKQDVVAEDSPMAGEFAGAPDWVTRGCSAFWGDDAPAKICGVGIAGGSRNLALMKTSAQARGRTEIARALGVRVKAMLKDYQSTTTGGEEFGTAASDEQHIVDVSKQLTEINLSGVEQQDMWISSSSTVYVLMVYDADKFQDAVAGMDNLSDNIRKAVIDRADQSFAELDEELEKN